MNVHMCFRGTVRMHQQTDIRQQTESRRRAAGEHDAQQNGQQPASPLRLRHWTLRKNKRKPGNPCPGNPRCQIYVLISDANAVQICSSSSHRAIKTQEHCSSQHKTSLSGHFRPCTRSRGTKLKLLKDPMIQITCQVTCIRCTEKNMRHSSKKWTDLMSLHLPILGQVSRKWHPGTGWPSIHHYWRSSLGRRAWCCWNTYEEKTRHQTHGRQAGY